MAIISQIGQYTGMKIGAVERRELIRNLLPGALEEGYTGNKALQVFQDAGLGIREGDYWEIWREIKGIEEQAQRIKFVRRDANVNAALFGDLLREQEEDYFLLGRYKYYDSEKDEIITGIKQLSTNTLGTRGSIEARMLEILKEESPRLRDQLIEMNLIRAYRRD